MKSRVITNWKSSLLGIVLLIIAVAMLYLKIITGGEFIALLPTMIGLLCAPDSIFRKLKIKN
jgi:hypothetical protein